MNVYNFEDTTEAIRPYTLNQAMYNANDEHNDLSEFLIFKTSETIDSDIFDSNNIGGSFENNTIDDAIVNIVDAKLIENQHLRNVNTDDHHPYSENCVLQTDHYRRQSSEKFHKFFKESRAKLDLQKNVKHLKKALMFEKQKKLSFT